MPAIFIVTLLVLIGSDILPSKVYAGSSRSSDSHASSDSHDSSKSGDSEDNDENHCRKAAPRQEAIENKIKYLSGNHQSLPKCTCGTAGTISKINIFNANSGKTTTLLTCSGCTGPDVPITSSAECENVPDVFHPDLEEFCQIVHPRCKYITVYRCGSPAVSTTEARPLTSAPLQATTSVPQPPVTTQSSPTVINNGGTPFFDATYRGMTYE